MSDLVESNLEEVFSKVIKKNRRSVSQNAMMWATLGDISDQDEWHGQKLSKRDWKWVFTAAVRKQRMVPGTGFANTNNTQGSTETCSGLASTILTSIVGAGPGAYNSFTLGGTVGYP